MRRNTIILAAAIVAAAVGAFIGFGDRYPAPTPDAGGVNPPNPSGLLQPHPPSMPEQAGATGAIEGTVVESIEVKSYTYLRLRTNSGEQWAAVPRATIAEGAKVRVIDASLMSNFQSPSLNHTFATIYFGVLDDKGAGPPQSATSGSAGSGKPAASSVEVGKVEPLTGDDARTVAQLFEQRTQLAGKRMRVRAVVTKVVANVMGRNWVHLQDGTGDAAAKTNDLVATSQATVEVGQQVVASGVVATDKEFGAGYRYDLLLEQAEFTVQP